jgi:hypothetical protein
MIATVIHYCTNEYRFLKRVVEEVRYFSDHVVLIACDHFFNGQQENRDLLHRSYQECSDCLCLEFAYMTDRLYHPALVGYSSDDPEWGLCWHSTSRYVAALFLPPGVEYVLFLDSDEVIDGKRFAQWLTNRTFSTHAAFRLGCFFYVHRATLRATQVFTSGLWVRVRDLDYSWIINPSDRAGLFDRLPSPKKLLVDEEGEPFIHHYSWVRPKEECHQKAVTWGHRLDRHWTPLIDQMFEQPSQPDLLHLGMTFEELPFCYFDPLTIPNPTPISYSCPSHVQKIDASKARRRELELLYS